MSVHDYHHSFPQLVVIGDNAEQDAVLYVLSIDISTDRRAIGAAETCQLIDIVSVFDRHCPAPHRRRFSAGISENRILLCG